MGITLDSQTYNVFQTNYGHKQAKTGSMSVGITGLPLRVEGGSFQNVYDLTLLCTTADIANLRTSFAKVTATGTPPSNLLSFTDEEGVTWNPNSSGGGNVNTGVFFLSMSDPKPLAPKGWSIGNRFTVQIQLQVYSANLSS